MCIYLILLVLFDIYSIVLLLLILYAFNDRTCIGIIHQYINVAIYSLVRYGICEASWNLVTLFNWKRQRYGRPGEEGDYGEGEAGPASRWKRRSWLKAWWRIRRSVTDLLLMMYWRWRIFSYWRDDQYYSIVIINHTAIVLPAITGNIHGNNIQWRVG